MATLMLVAFLMVAVTTADARPYGQRSFHRPNIMQSVAGSIFQVLPIRTQMVLRIGLPDNIFFAVFGSLDSIRVADGD